MRYFLIKKTYRLINKKSIFPTNKECDLYGHVKHIVGVESYDKKDFFYFLVLSIVKIRRGVDKEDVFSNLIFTIESNLSCLNKIDSRWLVSLLDTIADCGDINRSSKSLTISVFINMFKVVETKRKLAWFGGFSFLKVIFQSGNVMSWDGMTYYKVVSGDLLFNMIVRIEREIKDDCLLYEIWSNLIVRLREENKSFIDMLRLNSRLEKKLSMY